MERGGFTDLIAFVAVADNLSFRAAATQLGVTPSALSHSMRQLEERLGIRLLHRTTRSVSVTDAGFRLLEGLRPAMNQIGNALENLNQERSRPVGRLRIYTTHTAATAVIAPVWKRFLSTYPEIHLEVQVNEAAADIVAKGFDAGIGTRDRVAADMIAVRVMGPLKVPCSRRRHTSRRETRRALPMTSPAIAASAIANMPMAPFRLVVRAERQVETNPSGWSCNGQRS